MGFIFDIMCLKITSLRLQAYLPGANFNYDKVIFL